MFLYHQINIPPRKSRKISVRGRPLQQSYQPHMVIHGCRPLNFNCKGVDKLIYTKYMCLNQWTIVGTVSVRYDALLAFYTCLRRIE